MPIEKFPYDPVETLMKLNAIAKFERNPRVRLSSGLIPRERRWASSRSAWSLTDPVTISSSYLRAVRREPDLWSWTRAPLGVLPQAPSVGARIGAPIGRVNVDFAGAA